MSFLIDRLKLKEAKNEQMKKEQENAWPSVEGPLIWLNRLLPTTLDFFYTACLF